MLAHKITHALNLHTKNLFLFLALLLFTVSLTAADNDPHAHHKNMLNKKSYESSTEIYTIPNLSLLDSSNKSVSLTETLDTKDPVILNFIFTTCTTICPVLSATFTQVQDKLGKEAENLRMISITIDPEQDTPERLKTYSKRYMAGPDWQFLTGSVENIVATQKAFDAYRGNKMNHIPLTFIRSSNSEKWVRIEGFASATEIVKEYQKHLSN